MVVEDPNKKMGSNIVKCVRCGLINGVFVHVSVSGEFIAINFVDEEIQTLENHIARLKSVRAKEGILSCCGIVIQLCKAKIAEAREAGAAVNSEEVKKWDDKIEQYSDMYRPRIVPGDRGGGFYPYPYIFKPPKPPDDLGVVPNVPRRKPLEEEALEVELFCRYCGSELVMDESFCSVCGKKS